MSICTGTRWHSNIIGFNSVPIKGSQVGALAMQAVPRFNLYSFIYSKILWLYRSFLTPTSTSVTALTSFESASSSTTFSQISATWVTDEVTMEDNMGLIKQNAISLPSFYSSYQENWDLNYLHSNKFIPPKELFFQSFRSRSDLKL